MVVELLLNFKLFFIILVVVLFLQVNIHSHSVLKLDKTIQLHIKYHIFIIFYRINQKIKKEKEESNIKCNVLLEDLIQH